MNRALMIAWSFLREHRVRALLTIATIAAATAIVIWVVAGYEALLRSYDVYASRALGRYVLAVDPISRAADRTVPAEVLRILRAADGVAVAEPMWAEKVLLQPAASAAPPSQRGAAPEYLLLATDAPEPPFELAAGSWLRGGATPAGEAIHACLSSEVAGRLGCGIDDELLLGRDGAGGRLRIVGLVDNPPQPITGRQMGSVDLPSPSIAGAYVSLADAERIHARPAEISFIGIALEEGADVHAFRFAHGPLLGAEYNVQFMEDYDLEEELDEAAAARNVAMQSYGATALAMLLAFLVVFNTLNMGVTERVRVFAMLRAVCLTRRQLALVIVVEGLLLALVGFALGLLLGGGLIELVDGRMPRMMRHGASVGGLSLALAALASFGAALLAALVPAWRATRVRPLDAMAPQQGGAHGRVSLLLPALAGLLLVVVAPLLCIVFPPPFDGPLLGVLLIAYASLALGLLLLCPGLLLLTERIAVPLLARLLALNPLLLAGQVSTQLWRGVGAALALSLGLGLFVAIQTWGFTMLETFVPGPWAPDAMLVLAEPVDDQRAAELAALPGIAAGALPFVVEQPRLKEDLTNSAERASIIRQDNIIMLGVDGALAFGGDEPLFDCQWVRGTAAEAAAAFATGRAVVVPEHFLRESGLDVGDSFEVVPPEDAGHPARYTIAGSVRLTGWHWQTKTTGLRVRTHRAAALVFADLVSVRADFGLAGASHLWFDLAPGADAAAVGAAARELLGEAALQPQQRGRGHEGAAVEPGCRVVPVEQVRRSVRGMAGAWLWAMSALPLVAMAIASLGLMNLLLASVRARRWEMGVLRAVGFTRGSLLRLVIAESLLIAIVAAVLSAGGGVLAGWCGTGVASTMSFFGGMNPVLTIPWLAMLAGALTVALFAIGAALLPAWGLARSQTLTLLQQGRSAF